MNPSTVHIYSKDEHVVFIEEAIGALKERTQLMCHTIPYKRNTRRMTQSLVEGAVELLNYFPVQE